MNCLSFITQNIHNIKKEHLMKIEIRTEKNKIDITNYMKNNYVIVDINENVDNVYIDFDNDDERDRFIAKILDSKTCADCGNTLELEASLYCGDCYNYLDDKVYSVEKERDALKDKVEELEKEIFDMQRQGGKK